jgi:hypothetical protein
VFADIRIRKEPFYRRAAFETGLRNLGYGIHPGQPQDERDLLVLWNLKAGTEENLATLWEQRGGTVIVAENGYLQKVDKSTYTISTHGHNAAGWFPVGKEDRFTPLGFVMKPWQENPHGHHLVCGQRGIGSKAMASPPQWAEKMAAKLQREGKNVRLRLHPGNNAPKVPVLTDLEGAKMCLIWSSTVGIRALIEGIPVIHHAPHWICAGGGEHNRQEVLHRMAHGQWHHEEIAAGEPFARMAAENWGPRCW